MTKERIDLSSFLARGRRVEVLPARGGRKPSGSISEAPKPEGVRALAAGCTPEEWGVREAPQPD